MVIHGIIFFQILLHLFLAFTAGNSSNCVFFLEHDGLNILSVAMCGIWSDFLIQLDGGKKEQHNVSRIRQLFEPYILLLLHYLQWCNRLQKDLDYARTLFRDDEDQDNILNDPKIQQAQVTQSLLYILESRQGPEVGIYYEDSDDEDRFGGPGVGGKQQREKFARLGKGVLGSCNLRHLERNSSNSLQTGFQNLMRKSNVTKLLVRVLQRLSLFFLHEHPEFFLSKMMLLKLLLENNIDSCEAFLDDLGGVDLLMSMLVFIINGKGSRRLAMVTQDPNGELWEQKK